MPNNTQDFSHLKLADNQGLFSQQLPQEQNLSESQHKDIFKLTVEEAQQVLKSEQQANLEIQWTQYFTTTVARIQTSLTREDILKTSVEEVRQVLTCERVVIYSLDENSQGIVIAESVAPGYPRALEVTIIDPCFEARYIEKYQKGRVNATDNIYQASLTPCHIEQLEKLAVKANLVAPILSEGKLLGLLIAHQCSEPRQWQQHEIRWFSQIATQVGFALDNAKFLAQANSIRQQSDTETEWTQYFTETVRYIRDSLNKEDILKTATEEVRRLLMCDRVVVYGLDTESRGVVIAESVAPGCPRALGVTIIDPCFEAKYIEKYQNGRVRAIDNIYQANLTSCYIEQLEKLAVKANLVAPILNEGKLLGLFVAHQCSKPRQWQQHEIRWFSQIATQVGFALDNAKVLAQANSLRQQSDTETEWTQYFTETVRYIRDSLNKEDILKTATEEVRRLLMCDRVVVYGLDTESRGVVIAESVAPGCPRALGATIIDPCFEAKYIEKYQNGRVRATDNIYQANLTPCYIEQLEKLAVKANLVAPILNEGKLLGLFVAHQCSKPRQWQQHEIRWFSQIAMQVGFALDNAKVLAQANSLRQQADTETQWTHYFTDTIGLIRQSLKEEDILTVCVQEVRRVLACERVVVYSLDTNSQGVVIAESVAPGWSKALGVTIEDPCFEAKYIEKYQNGRVKAIDNIYQANLTSCYIEQLEKLAVKANLVAPILNEGKLLGLLVAHQCSEPRQWQQHEIRWFSQIAMQVGFALDNAKLSERNALAYELVESLSQQYSQQEEFQQQIVELLKGSENCFKTFSTKALSLSESLAATFKQIQDIADTARVMAATATQAELQVQLNHQTLQEGQETVKQSLQSISNLQDGVTDGTEKVKQLREDCRRLSDLMNFVSNITTQMNSQGINVAIAVSQLEISGQESVIANTEKVRTLRRQLLEVVGEIQGLIASIIVGANEVVMTMETGTQQILTGTQSLQMTQQKLYGVTAVSLQMNKLVEIITQGAANQTQTSNSASQQVISASNLVHQTLEQLQTFSESFTQLARDAQEVTRKNGFWENIRRSFLSSRAIVTHWTQKK